jgi:SAM-dependent methyltransferase
VNDSERWLRDAMPAAVEPPPEIDTTRPSFARAYDFALGGKNNFEVDRRAVGQLAATFPGMSPLAKDSRSFLRRGVRYLVGEARIRQLIDIGSGLPSADNVHEVAHEIDPTVRVVYVDHDPLVLAHGRAFLVDNVTTAAIKADAAEPDCVLDNPETRRFIDLSRPVAILLSGILHHVPDDQDPLKITRVLKDRMPSGSHLLVSNYLDDDEPDAKRAERSFAAAGLGTVRFRTWDEQQRFFDGLEMVEPGLVYANDWRPDARTARDTPWHTFYAAGIGRKP